MKKVLPASLERGESTIIFRHVPGEICDNCGEAFHSADVTEALLRQAEAAVAQGVEIDVWRLQRDGLLTLGRAFGWNWTRNGKTVVSIQVRTEAKLGDFFDK